MNDLKDVPTDREYMIFSVTEIDKIDFMEDDSRVQYQQSEGGFQIAADSGN